MSSFEIDRPFKRAKSVSDIEMRSEGIAMFCQKELSGGISNQKIRKLNYLKQLNSFKEFKNDVTDSFSVDTVTDVQAIPSNLALHILDKKQDSKFESICDLEEKYNEKRDPTQVTNYIKNNVQINDIKINV